MTSPSGNVFQGRRQVISLAIVLSMTFGVGLAFGIGIPLTTLTLESWRQPEWMIGLAGAAPALGVLLMLPFVPRIIGWLGPVAAIAIGCFIGALGFLALYGLSTPWAWVIARCLMCAGLALPWLGGETWINSVSSQSTRTRIIGIYVSVFFIGFALGPPILQAVGLTGIWPFLAGALGVSLSALPAILFRKYAPEFHHDETQGLLAAGRIAPIATIGGFVAGLSEMTSYALLPNVALSSGLTEAAALDLLLMLLLGGIFLQVPLGWFADKLSRTTFLLSVIALVTVLLWALPWLIAVPILPSIIAFLIGGIALGFYTSSLSIIGDEVMPKDLAGANAAFLVMYQLGGIAGPATAGLAMTWEPSIGFAATLSAVMLIFGAIVIALGKSHRRSAEPQAARP
jgi:MFS family permease